MSGKLNKAKKFYKKTERSAIKAQNPVSIVKTMVNELQKFSKKEDLKFLEKYKNVYNCEADLKDFLHTAYLVNEMDVILTIDTSLVHVSGTLGKKTFLFLPLVPDFRWGLNKNQEWYPNLELLRQAKIDDWTQPVKEAKKLIKKLSS